MRMILLLLIFVFDGSQLMAQENNCERIRKGQFLLLDSIQGNTQITRNKRIQIEKGEKSGLKLKLKVTWLDTCQYELRLIKILKNPKKIDIPKNIILSINVIQISEESYIEISSYNLGEVTFKRTILIQN